MINPNLNSCIFLVFNYVFFYLVKIDKLILFKLDVDVGGSRANEINFNENFTKTPKNTRTYLAFSFKIGV